MKKYTLPPNEEIKREIEAITFNTKTLNSFVNHNYKFRILVDEMIQLFYKAEESSNTIFN